MLGKLILVALGTCCLVGPIFGALTDLNSPEWLAYKTEHAKLYQSQSDELMRHSILMKNKQLIDHHNGEAEKSFEMGLNHLSDWTDEEKQKLLGFKLPDGLAASGGLQNTLEGQQFIARLLNGTDLRTLPKKVDWRKVPGRVSRVKDQGICGSCWAFSTTGILEGQEIRVGQRQELTPLSEQNLVDCAKEDGCEGNWPVQALYYIFLNGGIDSEQYYPYNETSGVCRYNATGSVMKTLGPVVLPQDEEILKMVVAKYGPVSISIDATDDFVSYKQGIFEDKECESGLSDINHSVLIVGYGTDKKHQDYWIVKNSWGPSWGEKGYVRMARNRNNMCGIATVPVIAAFDKYQ